MLWKAIGRIHRQAIIQEDNRTGRNFSGGAESFFSEPHSGTNPKAPKEGGKQAGKAEKPQSQRVVRLNAIRIRKRGGEGKKEEKKK